MKWTRAKYDHICTACFTEIKPDSNYLVDPYTCFCKKCGMKFIKGELHFDKKRKRYIDIKDKNTCDFCKEPPIGNIAGKAICREHIGEAVSWE